MEIVVHAVWLYYRFGLSLRNVEEMLQERTIFVSFERTCHWVKSNDEQEFLTQYDENAAMFFEDGRFAVQSTRPRAATGAISTTESSEIRMTLSNRFDTTQA